MIIGMSEVEESWLQYKSRILATKSTYKRAKEFLPYALVQSNLDTEDSEAAKKARRKRKRKVILESDSEDSSSVQSSFTQDATGSVQFENDGHVETQSTLSRTTTQYNYTPGIQRQAMRPAFNDMHHRSVVPSREEHPARLNTRVNRPLCDARQSHVENSNSHHFEPVPSTANVSRQIERLGERFAAFERKAFENQMAILAELRSIRAIITSSKATPTLKIPEDCPILPAPNADAVYALEEYLSTEGNSGKLVTYFSRYGGTDIPDAVRRLLRALLTKEAALKFSWKGSAGKKMAFSALTNINNMIHGQFFSFLCNV
ncbi:uncharacterized protein LOC125947488 [Dermacentor silvarum]|uniref:uncharacterized protein LOC125947488 n=1 Tax=Dermacentor silvarum TaxID=543639 RepID=UPI0021009641|nr:uncharacterized protein LOC125947488 [Dermacentor silvarum]